LIEREDVLQSGEAVRDRAGDHQRSSAYTLDLVEPEWPKVDAAIPSFLSGRPLSAVDFVVGRDGVSRLSTQITRVVASLFNESRP